MKKFMPRQLVTLLAALAALCSLSAALAAETVAYIDLIGPTVVAFLPSTLQQSVSVDGIPAQQQVAAALERARVCFGTDYAVYRIIVADRIVVRSRGREESFEIASVYPLVGALMLQPEDNPRIVFAGGGPEALPRLLPQAASDYFGRQCHG
jgi:hypothetical protein